MKISIFSAFPPFRGGIAQFSTKLSEVLENRFSLQLITFKNQYPNWLFPGKSQFDFNQKSILKTPIQRIISSYSISSYFRAISQIKKENPDVFITNYWMTFFAPFMGLIARKLPKNTKKIAIVHNLTPHEKRFFDKPFNRYFLNSYDGFIALSEFVFNDLKQFVPTDKIVCIPHPPYNQFGEKLPKTKACSYLNVDSNKTTFLFFGIIRKYKGLDLLIQAFDQLDDTFQLVIAGEVYGNDHEIIELIHKNKNKNRILFHNHFIADSDVHMYFSAADYLVLPYRSGTQSGVASIATNYQIPIIATNTGGLTELLTNHKDIIIKSPSIEDIQIALNQTKMKSVSTKNEINKTNVAEDSWEIFADRMMDFVHSIKK